MVKEKSYMFRLISTLTCCLCLLACQGQELKNREKGALAGGALGAGLGAIIGNQTGSTGAGIAIGSAMGALAGGVVGNEMDNQYGQLDEREARLAANQRAIEENKKIIEELKRKGADVRVTDRGVVVNLPDVLFEFNKAELKIDALRATRQISEVVKQYPERRLSVEGHTDSIGTIKYNQRLSENRARSVVNELVAQGVSRGRVETRGFGESDPIASNRTEAGRARNRRVEVIVENY
jgi:outer membrane protein OmpA-like peptidoglycan-associated protein